MTVTPSQTVLPPQVMLYITEPSNYFTISLTNTGKDNANIYLVMQVEQVNPASGLSLSTPPARQPKVPIVVPAGGSRILTPAEVRGLFNHIPLNEIKAPQDLFDNNNGSFGLLPEGQYELHMTAYRWDPLLPSPVVASSPSGGFASFSVCYNAQAPQFLTPSTISQELLAVAELDPLAPQFTWRAPVVACNPAALQFTYSMRIVEVLPGQQPDQSMTSNPVTYQVSNLATPTCLLPASVIMQMKEGKTYAAQVTATQTNVNRTMLNYVSIANNGKSTYKLFRLKETKKKQEQEDNNDKNDDDDDEDDGDEKGGEEEDDDISIIMAGSKSSDLVEDSLYTFRNPRIREPLFADDSGARKRFLESDIEVTWEASLFMGGEGHRSDTIEIEYELQFFDNGDNADKEETLKTDPFYTYRTKELKHNIEWDDIEKHVKEGDYMLLRIQPIIKKGRSIAFVGDENTVDFALCQRLSREYFECQSQMEIEDRKPTTKSANDLKGKVVHIGQYELTIDDIKGSGSGGFSGTGRVEWNPFGSSIMVCVKFDNLKLNQDDIVYDGIAETVAAPDMLSSMQVVDKLFSDWGIDNLIADSKIPYASQIQNKVDGKIKSLAEQINLGDYYSKMQKGKDVFKILTTGKMDKLYMPVKFPTEILPDKFDVVDLQIVNMKFAPTYATMNVLGEAAMPECDILKSKVLVFGAPRLCISPDTFLPQDGQIALLGDFTLTPSNMELTFKAPKDPLKPKDGCYISWHQGKLELLGIDADLKVDGMYKEVNGKLTDELATMYLKGSVGSWDDFLIDRISVDDFQMKDLPGWTFQASDVVFDHSIYRNSDHMGKFPEKYNKKEAGIISGDTQWQGVHIGKVGVAFPKSLELGEVDKEHNDRRLWVGAKEMFIDKSGVTVTIGAENVFAAKEGTLGGWGISLDEAHVQIIQNDFDNCGFTGQINVPILKRQKGSEHEGEFGNVKYTCQIRELSNPNNEKGKKNANDKNKRLSYIFLTEQVEPLDFSFLVGQATLDQDQTYFLVDAYDDPDKPGKVKTQIELCLGGEIGIGAIDKANDWLVEKTKSLPLELKIPELHFTKMRFSNVSEADDWVINDKRVEDKRKARDAAAKGIHDKALKILVEGKEFNAGTEQEPFYINLGEWSFASADKHIGPFTFNLTEFKPNFDSGTKKLSLEVGGSIGLCEVIDVGATVIISAKVNIPDYSKPKTWSISDGDVEFKALHLDLDWTALHFHGDLEATKAPNKGYSGTLEIDIVGFFKLDCKGGYYEHTKDAKDNKDRDFSWGYFMASVESSAGIHADPVVINRISGGFFFNCRPTKGENKFDGDPEVAYGNIGVALGLGLCTTAGKETLSADLDLLVVYDSDNKCLSTFMFNGKIEAVSGIITAECSLIYENEKNSAGVTQNRYLCLNVTAEAGMDTNALINKVKGMNESLKSLQGKLNEFQGKIDGVYQKVTNAASGMGVMSGDYNKPKKDGKNKEESEEIEASAGSAKITLEFKVTWVKDGKKYPTPKWHLYLGEPDEAHRCTFTFLKFKSPIITVDIGANGYLCLGNELPNNGALPEIPSKITEFLSGHKADQADMGADLGKAQRSRKAAAKALLDPNSLNGGVMVGASAWGSINIDLGLLYGSLEAIAGFDAALVNYGDMAFCMNSGSPMGYKGWYAMGQLYAYLAAELGIHVHIGNFINEKISILDAGIGGVLEMGLPNPTWMEGSARIKISLLGGLCKINKKFDFSAGDHCVPFKGNALDGFEMFQGVSHGSDSLYQALLDPTFAISLDDAKHMTFNTQSSIGSHYRLLDPSWESELKDKAQTSEAAIEKSIALNASRTYVFDMDQDLNYYNMKKGVRLFDLGTTATDLINAGKGTKDNLYKAMKTSTYGSILNNAQKGNPLFENLSDYIINNMSERSGTVAETSMIMGSKELNSSVSDYLADTWQSRIDEMLGSNTLTAKDGKKNVSFSALKYTPTEVNCSFRETQGTTFHLTGMNLKAGHSYALFLMADAFEIENGRRIWCQYIKNGKENRIHWRQTKAWFFRVKSDEEEKIITDSLRNLEPYIALAYPSYNGTRVRDERGEGDLRAYYNDIMKPTIALNRDIRTSLPADKMKWVLEGYTAAGDTLRQTRSATYRTSGNCINLEPSSAFSAFSAFTNAAKGNSRYDFNQEKYRLKLLYTYRHKEQIPTSGAKARFTGIQYKEKGDSTVTLVDLPIVTLPHDVKIISDTYTDSWKEVTQEANAELLPYSLPFVGASMDSIPNVLYEKDYRTKNLSDEDLVFRNVTFSDTKLPYRLLDPYMYFAYLGKWVFIGDREISPYAFDKVPVKFGSESLIFNYNGTVVNSEFLKVSKKLGERNKSLVELRDQMYSVWNNWNYNDSSHPKYPLPSVGSAIGGITANNQDGKTSTVTPININHNLTRDYSYVFEDLVKDYVAVYNVADTICTYLSAQSRTLMKKFYSAMKMKGSCNSKEFNSYFNKSVMDYNELHRGQYLESKSRGYSVRLPYYQLPLIYGDCFGGGAEYNGKSLDRNERTFTTSIGSSDFDSGDGDPENANLSMRWPSEASNLLFFRLGGANAADYMSGYNNQLFKTYKIGYDNNYPSANHVNWDHFRRNKALEQVTRFKARIYRVDGYDIEKGLYVVTSKTNGRGGGPWEASVNIGRDRKDIKNLADMYEAVEEQDAYRETHYDKQIPQAAWCEDTKTIYLYYSSSILKQGDQAKAFSGSKSRGTITMVYTKDDVINGLWRRTTSIRDKCTTVVVDQSFSLCVNEWFKGSLKNFFYGLKNVTTIEGMRNLTDPYVTHNLSQMFYNCESLTTIDFSDWYTQSVTDMSYMFGNCKKLKSLDLKKFNTQKVTTMQGMFKGCESLTTLNINNFKGDAVKDCSYMFKGCKSLYSLSMSSVNLPAVTNTNDMFEDCEKLTTINLSGLNSKDLEEMDLMFKNCKALTTLSLPNINTSKVLTMIETFAGCSSLTSLNLQQFTGESLEILNEMFADCVKLTSLDLRNLAPEAEMTTTYRMFAGCKALKTLHIDIFNPNIEDWVDTNGYMFYNVPGTLTTYYYSELNPFIIKQIPGTKKAVADNRAKVVHGRYSNGDEALFFIYSSTDYVKNKKYTITTNVTEDGSTETKTHEITVVGAWSGDNVVNTGTNRPEWCKTGTNVSKITTAYIDDKFKATPRSLYCWFYQFTNLETVKGLRNLNTEKVTTTSYMFKLCSSLTDVYIRLNSEDSPLTSMSGMFHGCKELTSPKIVLPNNHKVRYMDYMFNGCENLETCPVRGGNEVTNMSYMYAGCSTLKYMGSTPTITTPKVTDMSYMFKGCTELYNPIKLTSTENVTNMAGIYQNCGRLHSAIFSNTAKVTSMDNMFSGCTSLYNIDLSEITTTALKSCSNMFKDVPRSSVIYIASDATRVVNACPESTWPNRVLIYPASVVLLGSGNQMKLHFYGGKTTQKKGDTYNRSPYSGWVIAEVFSGAHVQNRTRSSQSGTSYSSMWNGYAEKITEVTIDATFKKIQLINAYGYFKGMSQLTEIKGIGNLNTKYAQDLGHLFRGCKKLTTIEGGSISTENCRYTDYMFADCESLRNITGVEFATSDNIVLAEHMFENCKNIWQISSTNYPHTAKVQDFSFMFAGCSSLTSVPLSRMGTGNSWTMESMFEGCTELNTSFSGLKSFDVKNVYVFDNMFKDCSAVASIDISTWRLNTSLNGVSRPWDGRRTINGMFSGCTSLRKLTLGSNFALEYVNTSTSSPFTSVKNLSVIVPKDKLTEIKKYLTSYHSFHVPSTGQFYDETATETDQVIWTPQNSTLTFFRGMPVQAGGTFNGHPVNAVWSGKDVLDNNSDSPKWYSTAADRCTVVTFDNSFANARPTSTRAWFSGFKKLKAVNNLENLHTINVTNMSRMFMNCESLTSLEFTSANWDMRNVTTTSSMFAGCKGLTSITLTRFSSTGKVKDIGGMFSNCQKLKEVNLYSFSTSSVTAANYLFNACFALKTLKVGTGFNFPSMSSKASYAFSSVSSLEIIATSSVLSSVQTPIKNKLGFIEKEGGTNGEFIATDKMGMQALWISSKNLLVFLYGKEYKKGGKYDGNTITEVWKVSGSPWTSTVKDKLTTVRFDESMKDRYVYSTANWFRDCSKLTTISNANYLNTSQCTNMGYMFYGCSSLAFVYSTNWDTKNVTNMCYMFYNCESLYGMDFTKWNTAKVTDMGAMFYGCKSLKSLDLSNWSTASVKNMYGMFRLCESLTTITGLDKWNTGSVTNMSYMFSDCKKLTTFEPLFFSTGNVTTMRSMFENCESWVCSGNFAGVLVPKYDVRKVTNMGYMFSGCKSLKKPNLESWETSSLTDMCGMFQDCQFGRITFGSKWNTSKVTDMSKLFKGCSNLLDTNLDLSMFNTSSVTTMYQMFMGCAKLYSLDVSNFNVSKVTSMSSMFENCDKLQSLDFRCKGTMKSGVYVSNIFRKATSNGLSIVVKFNSSFRVTTNHRSSGCFTNNKAYFRLYSSYTSENSTEKSNARTALYNMGYQYPTDSSYGISYIYYFTNGTSKSLYNQ